MKILPRFQGCLYLLKSLPLDLWTPEAEDLEQLRNWLLGHPLHSIQHKVARVIISHMNFDAKQVKFIGFSKLRLDFLFGKIFDVTVIMMYK